MYLIVKENIRIINKTPSLIGECFVVIDNQTSNELRINKSGYSILYYLNNFNGDKEALIKDLVEKTGDVESTTNFLNKMIESNIIIESKIFIRNNNLQIPYTDYNPLSRISIEVTSYCNLKCSHCYGGFGDIHNNPKHITYSDIVKISNDLDSLNSYQLSLTGGEFFLHPNYEEIFDLFARKGYQITLFTNGFYTKKIIDLVSKYQNTKITIKISIDGINNDHDEIRGVKHSFKKAIQTITELKKFSNVASSASITLTKKNIEKINEIKDFIKENLGCNFSADIAFKTNKNQNDNLLFEMKDFDIIKMHYPDYFAIPEEKKRTTNDSIRCIGGIFGAAITSKQELIICNAAVAPIFSFGSIERSSLVNLWKNPPENIQFFRNEKNSDITKCKTCTKHQSCATTNCRILALAHNNNHKAENPVLCYGNDR